MKGFMLDAKGDVVVQNSDIPFIYDDALLQQTCKQVIGTNKGEWFLNTDEGLDFHTLLGKAPDENEVRDEIADAITQVDESLVIDDFETREANRTLIVQFTAHNETGTEVGGEYAYGGTDR